MNAATQTPSQPAKHARMESGLDPRLQLAGFILLAEAALWGFLLFRWVTFATYSWNPLAGELALAQLPAILPYLLYGGLLALNGSAGLRLLRSSAWARPLGIILSALTVLLALGYFWLTREFWGTAIFLGLSGMVLILLVRHTAWSLAFPSAFFLLLFFILPIIIVFLVSLGERSRLGTVTYLPLTLENIPLYFNDYARFFSKIGGDYIYLRIFWRSVWIAVVNTVLCLIVGYPFAYWIARRPAKYRNVLIFLVMIPFWTNFLVRTYAWMLILRDSGVINNFWTITLHQQAVMLADKSQLFAWLAAVTENKLPLLFNQPAVMLGLFYGYLPFMILPLYANLERMDWSLLEAAADLGANTWKSSARVLLPLSLPGIVAGSIIVFIPTLGAYVTPDLMGGARVALLGNLLQQQFMTVRDWPFGAAIGFIMLAIMLAATIIYFRTTAKEEAF
jgi:spermidine/putrescine transport system permease protein